MVFSIAFLRKSVLKDASELTLGSDCLELCFWTVAFKNHPELVILQNYHALSKYSFKHN